MFDIICAASFALVLSASVGFFAVKILKKYGVKQTISGYVTEHKQKNGTPTMGGVIFVIPTAAAFLIFSKGSRLLSVVALALFGAYVVIGFLDDFIKIKFHRNDGLTPIQKIIFQTVIAVIASIFVVRGGISEQFIPFTRDRADIGWWFLPLGVFIYLAATNCVNLTDGLDGLAGTTSAVTLISTAALVLLQISLLPNDRTIISEYENVALLCVVCAASLGGFLLYNTNMASVFMGDTGSLALGGLICSAMIFTGNVFYLPIIGVTFVLSGASVIIQVLYYKRTKKRVFLMAPLHHHFQHKGYSESKIVFAYKLLSVLAALAAIAVYV